MMRYSSILHGVFYGSQVDQRRFLVERRGQREGVKIEEQLLRLAHLGLIGWVGRGGYILLMINQILATFRTRAILRPIYRLYKHAPVNYFCSSKDDKEKEVGETVISLGKQDIDMMKKFLKGSNIPLGETEQGQGEEFFQGEEVRLSLKLLQIDTVEQLKPFIVQYTKKKPEQVKDPNELTRCKFFILLKYINLQGSILSREISGLFKDISMNIKHLDEETFTVFLRLIANDRQAILLFHHLSSKVPLSLAPSHNNSELLSLLLMIYPQAKEDVYLHYYLKPTKETAQSQPKRMVYDPVNLIHILSHYFYYDDVHKLMEDTMRTTTVEDVTVCPEELMKSDEDLKGRKAEALIYAVNHELVEIYGKYLLREYFNFAQFSFKHAVQLLKSLSLSQKATTSQVHHSNMKECCVQLINILLEKKEAFISGEEDQLVENEHFKAISEILASYIRRKQPFLPKESIIPLVRSAFDGESAWRAKFDMYPVDELFAIIVSYKASKDFLMANQVEIDQKGVVLAAMLDSFKHMAGQAEPIQLFYVCLFAHQLKALPYIKSAAVLQGLEEFSSSKDLNFGMRQQLKKVLSALEEQLALQ